MKIEENITLGQFTTFRIGGPAKFLVRVKTEEDLQQAVSWAKEKHEKIFFLGGGSNILFMDEGFAGLVIKLENDKLEVLLDEQILVGAGVSLGKLVNKSVAKSLTGLEWAAGIPGTVGGAVRGNAGAFGPEMKDSVVKVKFFDTEKEKLELVEISLEECQFDYRSSLFKQNPNLIVWEVLLQLKKGKTAHSILEIKDILDKRNSKHPPHPSAGSIFKNPIVSKEVREKFELDKETASRGGKVPAGWLVECCGLKGTRIGGAMISEQQANFIFNLGNATAADVLSLISLAKTKVRNKYKTKLEEEVQIVYNY